MAENSTIILIIILIAGAFLFFNQKENPEKMPEDKLTLDEFENICITTKGEYRYNDNNPEQSACICPNGDAFVFDLIKDIDLNILKRGCGGY